jgi:hypothetical protein
MKIGLQPANPDMAKSIPLYSRGSNAGAVILRQEAA